MSVRARLAAFAAGLVVVFGATFTVGAALRPAEDERPTPTPTTAHPAEHEPSGHEDGAGS